MKFAKRKQPGRRSNKGPMPFSGIHLSQLTAARWVGALRGKVCCWCEPCLWKLPRFQWLLSAESFSSWMEFCSYSAPRRRRSNLYLWHVTPTRARCEAASLHLAHEESAILLAPARSFIFWHALLYSHSVSHRCPSLSSKQRRPRRSIPSADTWTLRIHMKKTPRQGSTAGLKVMIKALEGQNRFMGVLDHLMDKERNDAHPVVNLQSLYLSLWKSWQ